MNIRRTVGENFDNTNSRELIATLCSLEQAILLGDDKVIMVTHTPSGDVHLVLVPANAYTLAAYSTEDVGTLVEKLLVVKEHYRVLRIKQHVTLRSVTLGTKSPSVIEVHHEVINLSDVMADPKLCTISDEDLRKVVRAISSAKDITNGEAS